MKPIAIGLLIVIAMTGIVVGIQNVLAAIERGVQRRTIADMRSIASAVEVYRSENTCYPTAKTVEALQAIIVPRYLKVMPTVDSWNNAFRVESSNTRCTIYSRGKDGKGNNCTPGQNSGDDDEICVVNGALTRYPRGLAR
jgi:type II secretory pathway pseudopilin PulG